MSRIESYTVCTNFTKSHRAPKISPSSYDWGMCQTHDKSRGMVIASARLLSASLRKVFQTSYTPTGLRREDVNHFIKFIKYTLARINLFGLYLRVVNYNINVVASCIHALPVLPGFITHKYEPCAKKIYTLLEH